METILGIDTGTNSLGWAIVEKANGQYRLLDKGVQIFQEGVKIEKGIESSKAADRTLHRSVRKQYFRKKIRKIALLKLLIDKNLCPPLTGQALSDWRHKKIYPLNDAFMHWQQTNEVGDNPYAYRHRCLHEKLDLSNRAERYVLGRALYHLSQRRGFLSNRKEQGGEETGKVIGGIDALSEEMHTAGYEYLGDYFYHLYQKGEKIRSHYTDRLNHCQKELYAICEMQGLTESAPDLVAKLNRIIVTQRPLKSQKSQVGHCVFEKNKTKCPLSHPLYEEFRMLSLINNIKVRTPYEDELRQLNEEEREKILPLFYRKSKKSFDFDDIAKKIAGKATYGYYKDSGESQYLFNYYMDSSVSGCPVTTALKNLFGDDWVSGICESYTLADGKSPQQMVNDIWHALFFYEDKRKLEEFGKNRLQLSGDEAKKFGETTVPSGYAQLSLKAIGKILPYLRRGLKYSHAVFLANLCDVFPYDVWNDTQKRQAIEEDIIRQMELFSKTSDRPTLEVCVKSHLMDVYNIKRESLERLYHPSMIDAYPEARPNADGIFQLGSPATESIRNPMAMRSMYRLRSVVNCLLREGKITKDTTVHIEFARELNDANKRKAIKELNRENEKRREAARKAIAAHLKEEYGREIEPSDTDVLKYLLWEEQKSICLYTGTTIKLSDFIGAHPKYDIEHTIPQSAGGDSTMMNLTLCDSNFNRQVKKTFLPSELAKKDEIMQRIEDLGWKKRYEDLDKQVRRLRTGGAATKEAKDKIIQRRHFLTLQRDYWKGKCGRFTMETVPEGFSRRQGTDIGVISKYARLYLKSLFNRVFVVKGIATSDFRKMWGLQDEYTRKVRDSHVHHCIDAVTVACIGRDEYNKLAQFYHEDKSTRPSFPKPWPTFVEDIKKLKDEILVSHFTTDHTPNGDHTHIQSGEERSLGDAARGALHLTTYYGAIEKDGGIRYVVRKELSGVEDKDADKLIKSIVDETVQDIVRKAVAKHGSLSKAVEAGIWMNEEKRVPIKKVRCYAASVTNPLHIRHHRDISDKEYKRQFHVANDRNYMMAVYIGSNSRGKEKRGFEMLNMLQATDYYKKSNDAQLIGNGIVPQHVICEERNDTSMLPLAYTLKIGTMALLYEKTPSEIKECSIKELSKRLYKVTGLSSMAVSSGIYGKITLVHHEEARQSKEIKSKNGAYKQDEEYRASIIMLHTQLRALVEGYDFEINEIGEIKFLNR